MSSLDTNQPIYISEECRENLFKHILEEEQLGCEEIGNLYEYMFSTENLERYCLGATNRADYAYKKISKLLRKEYEEWKPKPLIFKDKLGNELKIGDRVRYYSYGENKPYDAMIESFAKSTVKIRFIGSKNKKWVNSATYLELITDDTEEKEEK